jgi:iduronate 2-sulfatase
MFSMAIAATRAEHYEVFLLAGQSNMDGRGAKKDLVGELASYSKPQPDVLIAFAAGGLHRPLTLSNGFVPLEPGYSGTPAQKAGGLPTGTFGPELSFGRTLATALPGKHVALIKYAEGGTNLRADWNPDKKGSLYEKFIAFTRQSLKGLKDRGDTYEIRGMIWHQGESDASLPTDQYQKMLTEFINRVRTDLAINDLPFVIGEVYDNGKRDLVRAAQQTAAKTVAGTYFASAKGLNTFDAGTHFDAASQIKLGQRFAEPLLKLWSSSTTP